MKPITALLLLIITTSVNPAIRPYEPKIVRPACERLNYFAVCVPRIKRANADNKVNWI